MQLSPFIATLSLALASAPGQAGAQLPPTSSRWCPSTVVVPNCPAPTAPSVTPGQGSTQPGQEQTPQTPQTPTDAFAQAPEGGTQPAASFSPNMYGDAFGGPSQRLVIQRSPIIIPGTPGTPSVDHFLGGTFVLAGTTNPATFLAQAVNKPGVFNPLILTLGNPATLPGVGTVFLPPLTHLSQGPVVVGRTGLPVGTLVPLQEQAQVRSAVLLDASTQFGTGGTLTLLSTDATLVNPGVVSPIGVANSTWTIATQYDYLIPGTPGTPTQVIPRTSILLDLPSPSGGVVGRTKIADDNSPMPRDRVMLGYDYFDGVSLTAGGTGVQRFSPGFEKTFLDGRASVEVRVPFAATIDTDIVADGVNGSGHGEIGDVNLTLKALIYRSPVLNMACGLGIALPTASDVHVALLDGTDVVRIRNDAVILTPYVAFLLTPTDRLFFQNWIQFGFDANGDEVLANPDLASGLRPVGRLNDQCLMQIDAQLGYWLYRSEEPEARLRGLAPFLELHYNTTLGKADSVSAGGFAIGDPNSRVEEFNLTAGFTSQIRDNFNLSVGAVVPLNSSENRTFDWQVGIRGSLYFGRTASEHNPAASATSF